MKQIVEHCEIRLINNFETRSLKTAQILLRTPFDSVHLDVFGPLSLAETENKYTLVALDALTRWAEAKATKRKQPGW